MNFQRLTKLRQVKVTSFEVSHKKIVKIFFFVYLIKTLRTLTCLINGLDPINGQSRIFFCEINKRAPVYLASESNGTMDCQVSNGEIRNLIEVFFSEEINVVPDHQKLGFILDIVLSKIKVIEKCQ